MQVIPVVDLIGGEVVRARMGDRDAYRPIQTPLSLTADPVDVVAGFLGLYPFAALYVADLDAIRGCGDNSVAARRLRKAFPELRLWIDNGAADEAGLAAIVEGDFGLPVIGAESQRDSALMAAHALSDSVALSLDFRGETFLGPPEILAAPRLWPNRVIVMTLARVGSGAGPDFSRLQSIRSAAPTHEIFAAGGVRGPADLAALKAAGLAGALIASALHDGRLTRADLEKA